MPQIVWFTGNTGSGKTTAARRLAQRTNSILLDGDALREIWPGLGLDEMSRRTQNLRAARLARMLADQGRDVVVATICPYRDLRAEVKRITNCEFMYMDGGKAGPEYPYEGRDGDGI